MPVNPNAAREVLAEMRAGGKTPAQIIANIERYMDRTQHRTVTNLAAQRQRADRTRHIRAGGAAGTKGEGIAQVKALVSIETGRVGVQGASQAQIQQLTSLYGDLSNAAGWSMQEARNKIGQLAQAIKEADKNIPGKLAILFRSGGPFLYPSSTPSDYASLLAAGSKGKQVWRMALGPDKHPSYFGISIDPSRVIDSRHVASSSWVLAFYLYGMP